MRHPPTQPYNGITIVLSHPSRFDTERLLSGTAGAFFEDHCLCSSLAAYDIRTANDQTPLISGTKSVLLLGQLAVTRYTAEQATIHKLHGSPITIRKELSRDCSLAQVYGIPSYFPQDAQDPIDYESLKNPRCPTYTGTIVGGGNQDGDEDDEDDGGGVQKGRHTIVSRKNYRFWLQQDTRKAKMLAFTYNGILPESKCRIDAPCDPYEAVTVLNEEREGFLYLDIETDTEQNINCVGFAVNDSNIYVFPLLDCQYKLFFGREVTAKFIRAFVLAMSRLTTICHNSFFDVLVLAWKYHLPIGRQHYDTMVAMRRAFPECEIALSHAISLYTWANYHKDAGVFMPYNRAQEQQLWNYNALDVKATREVHHSQRRRASCDTGLEASITQGNSMIYTYILMSLLGMRYAKQEVTSLMAENDKLMTQLLRLSKLILQEEFLPTSPKQCAAYFQEALGYPVLKRKEKTGNPVWDEDVLRKLKIRNPLNKMIDICLRYRGVKKETGSLKFIPWKEMP